MGDVLHDIRYLATKLKAVDPEGFGILKCRDVVKDHTRNEARLNAFRMIFEPASAGQPCSLRSRLASQQAAGSVTDRVQLARRLAASVSYIHTLRLVHKNIRPDNLIGFETAGGNDPSSIPFYLTGFEQVRTIDGRTYMRDDTEWAKNLYRHPQRQGQFPEEKYNFGHDTYSLGVCLLEIRLWDA